LPLQAQATPRARQGPDIDSYNYRPTNIPC
jgi:hypothetical protein